MPRKGRLEIPGALYHVISRGIERRDIFNDDLDRMEFLRRFGEGLIKTGIKSYGWVLMPNHFHLLVQTGSKPLSDLMRKLLSGYAQYFNRRYKRCGYLFQGRYKSILCDEEKYFLELVRYIHLNPLRAKLVEDMPGLNNYKWCGHSVLIGTNNYEWQATDYVLEHFGERKGSAIKKYLNFIKDGQSIGKRDDLTGGGLKRSAGGWSGVFALKRNNEMWQSDDRILGAGNFVEESLKIADAEDTHRARLKREGWDTTRLIDHVCHTLKINREELNRKGRQNNVARAKGLIAYWGKRELGIKGTELGKILSISKQSVSLLVSKGESIVKEENLKLTSCPLLHIPIQAKNL